MTGQGESTFRAASHTRSGRTPSLHFGDEPFLCGTQERLVDVCDAIVEL